MMSFPPSACLQGPVSLACKKEVGTLKGGKEFLRDTENRETLPAFSSSHHGTKGPAQSNGVERREEDRTGARTWAP